MVSFIKEYAKNPMVVGAIVPSSRYLAKGIVKPIDFTKCNCIVEYGPGTGVFTKEIIARKKRSTKVLLIEANEEFYKRLRREFHGKNNVIVIHGTAELVNQYREEYHIEQVDYIVSGLPFTSLPEEVSTKILHETKLAIEDTGVFITFQYTMLKKKVFETYMKLVETRYELRNMPPAHILVLQNKNAIDRNGVTSAP